MRAALLVALLVVIAAVVVIVQRLREPAAPPVAVPTPEPDQPAWKYAVQGAAGIGGLLLGGPGGASLAIAGAQKAGA